MRKDPAVESFLANPLVYEFFQAIRILSRRTEAPSLPENDARFARDSRFNPETEPARIGGNTSFAFPASDIQSITEDSDGSVRMKLNVIRLAGFQSPLPQYFTSLILKANAEGDRTLEDFLDIFNHRLAYLFYYAWEKSRFLAAFDRTGRDPLGRMLASLAGVPADIPSPGRLPSEFFVRYAPLLAVQPRSSEALRVIIGTYFEVEVDLIQYAGTWRALSEQSRTRLDEECGDSGMLGEGAIAGNEFWSLDSMVRIRIGPLCRGKFERFLPGGDWNGRLREICRFFSGDEIEFELQPVLARKDVPLCRLEEGSGLRLGWTTWSITRTPEHDNSDVTFRL